MKALYVRHGLTQYSIDNKFAGCRDIPIVGLNEEEMKKTRELIDKCRPEIILSSPLIRAIQTKDEIMKSFNFDLSIVEPLLKERNFGCFEGELKTELNRDLLEKDKSVEDLTNLDIRVNKFIKKYYGMSILVLGHSAFYRRFIIHSQSIVKESLSCCESQYVEIETS
ncbi:histidine phosphatase family protein [Salinivibrio kushneri]|uniref:histidine phosphatase family protein n=1 Tax=Salinivibrio kushneri TaxID=1908198 RepID=UPI0009889319|nr:histidine phosphatase family protein [Salinivibrio kushneri]OOE54253.1 hypothetical protein BZG12_07045 [Salinivibrio kushneri]